jgi:epoxide hydrolase-like predicted phosphatase
VAPERRSGLLIDWYGVMTTEIKPSFDAFCTAEGVDPERMMSVFEHDTEARELLFGFEEGRVEEDVFAAGFAAALGMAPERADGLSARLWSGVTPHPDMIALVRAARGAGVRTGLISNSWSLDHYDFALLGELFDAVVISGREGMRKPAPAIYELGAERLGVAPEACVFVDDLAHNLDAPRALGMAAVHHTDPATTAAALEDLLGVALGR